MSYRLPAGSIKREENVINIAKPCIHKAAGSRISEMLFPVIFSWKYVAGDMFMNQGLTNSVYSLPQANLFQFGIIVCQFILVCTKNSKAYVFMQAFSPIAYRFLSTECPWFSLFFTTHHIIVLRNVFHVRDKKCLMLPCIKLCVTGNLLRGGCRTRRT